MFLFEVVCSQVPARLDRQNLKLPDDLIKANKTFWKTSGKLLEKQA
jgi:hypothetical protein